MPPQTRGRKPRQSEYGKRLVEKQRAKREYGVRERQFRRYFELAQTIRSATGSKLLELLERRLDNVLYRLDLAQTRRQARQWINHGHVNLNGKRMSIPSYQVKIGDEIRLEAAQLAVSRGSEVPSWLKPAGKGKTAGTVQALPNREDIAIDIDEQMIVEFYSR